MRRLALASAATLALGATAAAADLSMPYKAPYAQPAASGWTGFYLGINGGGGIGLDRSDFSVAGTTFATVRNTISGGLGGVQAGYNYQAGMFVVGVEADYQFSNLTGGVSAPCVAALCGIDLTATYGQKMPWFGTARVRLGFTQGGWLLYVTGGYTYARLETDAFAAAGATTASYSLHENRGGWNAGTGIEVMLTGNWTARVEYLYLDLGTRSSSMTFTGLPTIVDNARFGMHLARLGVNYKF